MEITTIECKAFKTYECLVLNITTMYSMQSTDCISFNSINKFNRFTNVPSVF